MNPKMIAVAKYHRKVIRITAEDSPNVKRGLLQLAAGQTPDNKIILPGVLTYEEYRVRRKLWDRVRQCIGLDAQFYLGAELLLFPPDWLNKAADIARGLRFSKRTARAIGIDPAEGGDLTAMAAVDEFGLIELVSKKTPDTNVVIGETIAFMRKHSVPADFVMFDRGGGGKEHADRLRAMGHQVRTISFGEMPSVEIKRGMTMKEERIDVREERYAYKNKRAEMYHQLSLLLELDGEGRPIKNRGFAIPAEYSELRQELAPMPKLTDEEGRLYMLPKNKKDPNSTIKTLVELIGHSPDRADALVIAVHRMNYARSIPTAGAAV